MHLNTHTPSRNPISPIDKLSFLLGVTGRESFTCICVLAPLGEHLETVQCEQLCVFLGTARKITCQTFRPDGGESGEHVSPYHKPDFFIFPPFLRYVGSLEVKWLIGSSTQHPPGLSSYWPATGGVGPLALRCEKGPTARPRLHIWNHM